ncbi:hypothetical protein C8R45DRAFT_786492, partial [Mycena sanguinolenta]
ISILTQVARSLPEMLPEPESQSGSIFEDESHDDYVGISTSSIPPITSTQSLEMLVADKVYDEAERVLDALLEVGTPVPPSFAYEDAAIWAIRTPASTTADMDEQIKAFRKWFSLIPLGPSPRGPRPRRSPHEFARLRKRIMLSPLNSLRLIMEFGLIAAEKGYAHITHRHVISVVCMYGDPDVALQYIDELRDRNRKFLEQRAHATQVDALDNKLRVEIISVAIKTFAIAGRFDYAVQLIPDPTETHFHLRPASYSYLVHKMEMTRDRRYIPHIQFVTQHKSEARHRSVGLKKMKKPRLAQAVRCLANIGRFDLALKSPQRLGSSLAASLRTLRNGFRTRLVSSALPPNPLTVVGFLEAYFASGRTRAIILLRNLALSRGSHSASCSYIFAEMLFHARRGNPDLVIYTFVTHFFIVGLPRDDLLMRLQKMERDRASEALWTAAPQMKLFPHSMHAAVVWRALLDLARDERALEALYAKVLSFADKRSPQAPVLAAGIPLLNPPPVWKTGVDASAFTPFIRRMCRTFGTERGALILRDMVRLGIQPTIHQLTQLAIEYSRAGEVAKTFLVLDQVENATKAWETTKEANSGDHDEVARRRAVDPVFYRGIVRGFLFSNRIVEARNVERRMFKRYGYVPGEDSYVDELYEDL